MLISDIANLGLSTGQEGMIIMELMFVRESCCGRSHSDLHALILSVLNTAQALLLSHFKGEKN